MTGEVDELDQQIAAAYADLALRLVARLTLGGREMVRNKPGDKSGLGDGLVANDKNLELTGRLSRRGRTGLGRTHQF
jgi:hypothetical protein